MRIAFVVTEYVTEPEFAGGLATYTYRISQGLKMLGHEVDVFWLIHDLRLYRPDSAQDGHSGTPGPGGAGSGVG